MTVSLRDAETREQIRDSELTLVALLFFAEPAVRTLLAVSHTAPHDGYDLTDWLIEHPEPVDIDGLCSRTPADQRSSQR